MRIRKREGRGGDPRPRKVLLTKEKGLRQSLGITYVKTRERKGKECKYQSKRTLLLLLVLSCIEDEDGKRGFYYLMRS